MDTQGVLGHKGNPEDVANVASFFASKDSHFITGASSGV